MPKKTLVKDPPKKAQNPTTKFYKIDLDGVEYSLCFNYNKVALAEDITGLNLLAGLNNLTNLTAGQFKGLLFAALIMAQPEITFEEVGELLRLDTMLVWQYALGAAYDAALPERKKEDAGADPNAPTPEVPA